MADLTTAVLIDDHPLIHLAVENALAGCPDIALVGKGESGESLWPLLDEHQPGVVLLDLNLPQRSKNGRPFQALPALTRLAEEFPDVAVIILSQHAVGALVRSAVESGVKGYLLKSDPLSIELPAAIRAVGHGGVYFTETIHDLLFTRANTAPSTPLTTRQLEIIRTIAAEPDRGLTGHAADLGIAESTLRNHLSSAYAALEVSHFAACLVRCLQLGYISYELIGHAQIGRPLS